MIENVDWYDADFVKYLYLLRSLYKRSSHRSNMWPKLLDMSKDECKRLLRRTELEAYAGIVSAFRAQGDLTKDKKHLLNELSSTLR